MKRFAIGLILAVVCHSPLKAQTPDFFSFDRYVQQAVLDWEVPGLAIAVVKDGEVAFADGYGVKAVGGTDSVDVHTLFANASTTKAFVSMAVALMVDEGKVGFDDPVIQHVPEFGVPGATATRNMTVRHLLSHRTGFGDPYFLWYGMPANLNQMIERLPLVPNTEEFSPTYAYNNVTFATAGEVAARAAETDWESLVQTRILDVLGMTESVTNTTAAAENTNIAMPHDKIDGRVTQIDRYHTDNIGAAGAMYSSVWDMTKWMTMLLDSGVVGGERFVSEDSYKEMFSPQSLVSANNFYPTARLTKPNFTAYGLAWFLQDYRGEKIAFHTGSIDGMVAIVGLLQSHNVGVVVFANLDHAELRHALMFRVFDMYLGGELRDWSTDMRQMYAEIAERGARAREEFHSERIAGTSPTLALDRYAGRYSSDLLGEIEITLRDGVLEIRRSDFFVGEMEHWHYDTFRTVWQHRWVGDSFATFRFDMEGGVAGIDFGAGGVYHKMNDND